MQHFFDIRKIILLQLVLIGIFFVYGKMKVPFAQTQDISYIVHFSDITQKNTDTLFRENNTNTLQSACQQAVVDTTNRYIFIVGRGTIMKSAFLTENTCQTTGKAPAVDKYFDRQQDIATIKNTLIQKNAIQAA
jgi:hypothetical protein